tara:strand:- start:1995 stop:2801 length:807 start_codon:yes stop_codon:yes gene_type:complete
MVEDSFTGGDQRDYADEMGWFKILQRGKKAYVDEMLRREEQGINPRPGDNENRCDGISLEIIKEFFESPQLNYFLGMTLGDGGGDYAWGELWKEDELRLFLSGTNSPAPFYPMGDDIDFDRNIQTYKLRLDRMIEALERWWSKCIPDGQSNFFEELGEFYRICKEENPTAYPNISMLKPNKRWFPVRKPDKVESDTQLLDKIKQYLPKIRSSKGLAEDLPNINMTDRELKIFLNEYYKLGTEDDPYDNDDDEWPLYDSMMKWEEVLQK